MAMPNPVQARKSGRCLVLLKQPTFAEQRADIQQKFKSECVNSRDLSRGAIAPRDRSLPVILESLGIGIFYLPRKELEDRYGADSVIDDLSLIPPDTLTTADGVATEGGSCVVDESHDTWGRQAVHAPANAPTGRGVKVCVIDTGLDFRHPDFRRFPQDRMRGFSDDHSIIDSRGHGTHCTGIICGPLKPRDKGARYGVAPNVDLFVANIFGLSPETFASDVFEAVEWAIAQKCDIVSLSLQRPVLAQDGPSSQADIDKFEAVAKRALDKNILMVACTGNASDRKNGNIVKASFPACCPSVLAVGGVDNCLKVLNNSNGDAEVYGPAAAIRSAAIGNSYKNRSGTSMAAAFVSGVAALHAENDSTLRGARLLTKLKNGGGKVIQAPARMVKAP